MPDKETWETSLDFSLKAMEIMNKRFPGKKNGGSFSIECPQCNGILRMIKSSYNGHIHGKCETDKCLNWTE